MCECDDYPIMATDIIRKARKSHRCCECRESIEPGQEYYFHKSLFDSAWQEYKMCLRCRRLFALVEKASHPDCVCFTQLKEAYLELRTTDDFEGLVPQTWVDRAKKAEAYRQKYYGGSMCL